MFDEVDGRCYLGRNEIVVLKEKAVREGDMGWVMAIGMINIASFFFRICFSYDNDNDATTYDAMGLLERN